VSEYKLGEDGRARDPEIWEEWMEAVAKVVGPDKLA
jgi:hypothetical protein